MNASGLSKCSGTYANYFKGLRDFKQHRLQLVTLDGVDDIRAKLRELETIPFEPAV